MNWKDCMSLPCALTLLVIVTILVLYKLYFNRLYAWYVGRKHSHSHSQHHHDHHHGPEMTVMKDKLFKSLKPGCKIVEIGAGGGSNFEYYPENCEVTCIEPKVEFSPFFKESLDEKGKHLANVDLKRGVGEDLSKIVDPDSVDFVVATMVLCSVKSIEKTVQEIKKVLKPGGQFLFIDHVYAEEGHFLARLVQNCLTILTLLIVGSRLNTEPWKEIEAAGFSKFIYERRTMQNSHSLSPARWMVYGSATK